MRIFCICFINAFLFLFFINYAHSGHLILNGGYGLKYKSYSRTSDGSSEYKSGNQLDDLFLKVDYKRELLKGHMGDIGLKTELSDYNLNYFEHSSPDLSVPFSSNKKAETDNGFFYNVNPRANIRLPKKNIRFRINYLMNKTLDKDTDNYFESLDKITSDIPELETLTTSLSDSKKEQRQKYYFYKTGDFDITAKYFAYNYDYAFESENYLKNESYARIGAAYKDYAGVYYESEKQMFSDSENNSDEYSLKLGTIGSEGYDKIIKLGNLRLSGYAERSIVDESSLDRDKGAEDTYAETNIDYVKGIYSVENQFYYEKNDTSGTGEVNDKKGYKFSFESAAVDLSYYLESEIYREYDEQHRFEENDISAASFNTLVRDELAGTGTVLVETDGDSITIDFTSLEVDGDFLSTPNEIIDPGESYEISFNESISGSINLINGDPDDVSIYVFRDLETTYNKDYLSGRAGYNFKNLDYFKNRFRIEYQTMKYDYEKGANNNRSVLNDDSDDLKVSQEFDIRPWFLIFDKWGSYEKRIEKPSEGSYEEEWRENYNLQSKDGIYTEHNKFYVISKYDKQYGQGYDTRWRRSYQLFAERSTRNLVLGFYPMKEKEVEVANYVQKTEKYRFRFRLFKSNLTGRYETKKREYFDDGTSASKEDEDRVTTLLNYRLNLRNVKLNAKYRSEEYEYTTQDFEGSMTLIKYRGFPDNAPYAQLQLGFERQRDDESGEYEEDDYFKGKLTYTPTSRLAAVFSFEKQIDANRNEGIDYEFIAKYSTSAFNLSLGYRRNETTKDDIRRVEDVVYFEIRKTFGLGYRAGGRN